MQYRRVASQHEKRKRTKLVPAGRKTGIIAHQCRKISRKRTKHEGFETNM